MEKSEVYSRKELRKYVLVKLVVKVEEKKNLVKYATMPRYSWKSIYPAADRWEFTTHYT